jgi:hypothetical protein
MKLNYIIHINQFQKKTNFKIIPTIKELETIVKTFVLYIQHLFTIKIC